VTIEVARTPAHDPNQFFASIFTVVPLLTALMPATFRTVDYLKYCAFERRTVCANQGSSAVAEHLLLAHLRATLGLAIPEVRHALD
jgi:hypothetical protein